MPWAHLGLPQAWRSRAQYTLIDSNFAEGLRFLQLWDLWRQDTARPARLHVVSLSQQLADASVLRQQLQSVASAHLLPMAEQLIDAWPLNLPGTHRLEFEGMDVTLTLVVGPLERTVPRLAVLADVVLLSDALGLSQESLPVVWREALPKVLRDPKRAAVATLAGSVVLESFTCNPRASTPSQRLLDALPVGQTKRHAIVVGAGVAGVGIAQALALRHWRVQMIDVRAERNVAHGAHLAAALTPMVSHDDDVRARLSRAGSLRAQARWSHVSQESLWRCGALQLERVSGRIVDLAAVAAKLSFPERWVRYVDAEQASAIADLSLTRGGLYFPTAARLQPERLLGELMATSGLENIDASVNTIQNKGGQWQALEASGRVIAQAPQLVLACAQHTSALLRRSGLLKQMPRLSEMHALGGEITLLPAAYLSGGPRCIVSGDGYVLPALDMACVVGSSYLHGAEQIQTTPGGIQGNIERAANLLGEQHCSELFNNPQAMAMSGWAGWRAVLPGRLPAVGPVAQAEGLWVAAGFASRGFTWASLAGDLIAAALNGEPLPLERDIIDKISQT